MKLTSMKSSVLFRAACLTVTVVGAVVGIRAALRYASPVLLPFFIAWLLSLGIRPLVLRLSGKQGKGRRFWSALLVLLFVFLTVWGIFTGCERLLSEIGRLMERLAREESGISRFLLDFSGWFASLSARLPFLDAFSEHPSFDAFCAYLDSTVKGWASSALSSLGEKIPTWILSVLSRLPSLLIFITTLLLSCYYFCADPRTPGERLEALVPDGWKTGVYIWRVKLKRALSRYLRAYLLLSAITFVEMLLGLTILKSPYAFLMAMIIALVDFLPLLGAGAILVPWAMGAYLVGHGGHATGLLLIFGVHTLLRQILEPKLVSRELGLPPLVSLFAVYAGWQLGGVVGMLVAPLIFMIVKEIRQSPTK